MSRPGAALFSGPPTSPRAQLLSLNLLPRELRAFTLASVVLPRAGVPAFRSSLELLGGGRFGAVLDLA